LRLGNAVPNNDAGEALRFGNAVPNNDVGEALRFGNAVPNNDVGEALRLGNAVPNNDVGEASASRVWRDVLPARLKPRLPVSRTGVPGPATVIDL